MSGRKVTLHGTGLNKRNFLYVDDVARAFELLLFKGQVGEIYNIGGTHEYANIEIARQLIQLAGYGDCIDEMMTFVEDRVFNDFRYNINSSRLHELGWKGLVTW